ncbi:MAG TPA: hypothetical protein PLJ35_05085 [Anaerolineae bacterium]|nr:hypothetical protein [Anaerolineae bacterium]
MSKPLSIRIVSDGTVHGSRLETEDGQALNGVESAVVSLDVDERVIYADVTMRMVPLDLRAIVKEAVVRYWQCPECNLKLCAEYCPHCGLDLRRHEHSIRLTEFVAAEAE